MTDTLLLDEIFTISAVDSARYDRVIRIQAESVAQPAVRLTLDVNSEIYPLEAGETISLQLTTSLALDGSKDVKGGWREPRLGERSLADDYDYVCYGKVYKFEEKPDEKTAAYISFGGLLMCVEATYKKLASLKHDSVYLLIRR